MIVRLVLALVLVGVPVCAWGQACGNVTAVVSNGGSTTLVLTLPGAVAAGDSLHFAAGFGDETNTVTAGADTVNGAWGGAMSLSPPADDGGGTFRSYLGHRLASAAGTPTITITFSGSVAASGVAWSCAAANVATFEEYATPAIQGGLVSSHPSPTGNATCASGVVVGNLWVNSSRTTTFATSTKINSINGNWHPHFFTFASAGNKTDTATSSSTVRSGYQQGVFCASGGGGGPTANRRQLLGVGP